MKEFDPTLKGNLDYLQFLNLVQKLQVPPEIDELFYKTLLGGKKDHMSSSDLLSFLRNIQKVP